MLWARVSVKTKRVIRFYGKFSMKSACRSTKRYVFMLTQLGNDELKGMFRMGWVMDYPSIENYLAPIYGKGAGSNYYGYDNADFQKKMREAGAAETPEEANKLYQEAEGMIAKEFTTIPTWYDDPQATMKILLMSRIC